MFFLNLQPFLGLKKSFGHRPVKSKALYLYICVISPHHLHSAGSLRPISDSALGSVYVCEGTGMCTHWFSLNGICDVPKKWLVYNFSASVPAALSAPLEMDNSFVNYSNRLSRYYFFFCWLCAWQLERLQPPREPVTSRSHWHLVQDCWSSLTCTLDIFL